MQAQCIAYLANELSVADLVGYYTISMALKEGWQKLSFAPLQTYIATEFSANYRMKDMFFKLNLAVLG